MATFAFGVRPVLTMARYVPCAAVRMARTTTPGSEAAPARTPLGRAGSDRNAAQKRRKYCGNPRLKQFDAR